MIFVYIIVFLLTTVIGMFYQMVIYDSFNRKIHPYPKLAGLVTSAFVTSLTITLVDIGSKLT